MRQQILARVGLLLLVASSSGCTATLRTQVKTLSDRPPVASSTYRIALSDAQAADLETSRVRTAIDARMSQAGFVRVDDSEAPEVTVRFTVHDEASPSTRPAEGPGVGASRSTSVSSSQGSVAGIGVPLTRSRSVSRGYEYGVGTSSPTTSWARTHVLELMFSDEDGPSHKVTVSTETATTDAFRQLAPCLVQAAFDQFPGADGQDVEIRVRARDCRAS